MNENKHTGEKRDLNNLRLKENPFSLPEGYFKTLEESVHARIHPEIEEVVPSTPFFRFLSLSKSYIVLAFSFFLILGIGYGVLTITSPKSHLEPVDDSLFALIENGYINPAIIDDMYDDIAVEDAFIYAVENTVSIEEINKVMEASLSEKEILYYLGIEFPDND